MTMWLKFLHDVGLQAARAGVKEALKKIDESIAEPPAKPAAQKIEVDVLCVRCKHVIRSEDVVCPGCGMMRGSP